MNCTFHEREPIQTTNFSSKKVIACHGGLQEDFRLVQRDYYALNFHLFSTGTCHSVINAKQSHLEPCPLAHDRYQHIILRQIHKKIPQVLLSNVLKFTGSCLQRQRNVMRQ